MREQRAQLEEQVAQSTADVAVLKASLGTRDEQLQALNTKLCDSEEVWLKEKGQATPVSRSACLLACMVPPPAASAAPDCNLAPARVETMEAEITTLTRSMTELDTSMLKLQTELTDMRAEHFKTNADLTTTRADNGTLNAEIVQLEQTAISLQAEHLELQEENIKLKVEADTAHQGLDAVDTSVKELRVKLRNMEKACLDAEDKLALQITRTCAEKLELGTTPCV